MSFAETAALGALAGLTIYVGLPLGRMERVGVRMRVSLAMLSVGILAFIFMDVTSNAQSIVSSALSAFKDDHGSFGHVLALFALLAAGFTTGLAGISAVERWLRGRPAPPPIAGGATRWPIEGPDDLQSAQLAPAGMVGAGAAAVDPAAAEARRRALRTGMVIAIAIGLHNFAEGLAIGVSAKTGAVGLATVLIIGFGLHNATEGFGIVGPLGGVRPSWKWLGLAGIVAGGPTFLGTLVGFQVTSSELELLFYALAGGAVLYVIGEIWTGMRRYGHRTLGLYMLAAGFLLGVATDLVVTYGGA
ncbi:MAG TPA: ZIP family metal transporter [Solirubrobacteraceae bacterium]|jgi:ZIP family zinc transporter|nr:ZIP family metal transporter [Solirubrobacteraceae bacterium]